MALQVLAILFRSKSILQNLCSAGWSYTFDFLIIFVVPNEQFGTHLKHSKCHYT